MSETTPGIEQRLALVRSRIEYAAARFGRDPGEIRLVAASKTFDASAVRQAHAAGQVDFGENYVQEAIDKMGELGDLALVWHFIGPIQSNKTRAIAEHFDWVHSVDRLKVAERLSAQRPASMPPLEICLEVNISGEASKGGVAVVDLPVLAQAVAALPRLRLRGLMAIPAPSTDPAEQRAAFAAVRRLYEALRASGYSLDTLSMGMSGDLEAAIAEGATMVRVGTAIFGERVYA
jgi:pyridoxal phosphate enzyme (YggS family)